MAKAKTKKSSRATSPAKTTTTTNDVVVMSDSDNEEQQEETTKQEVIKNTYDVSAMESTEIKDTQDELLDELSDGQNRIALLYKPSTGYMNKLQAQIQNAVKVIGSMQKTFNLCNEEVSLATHELLQSHSNIDAYFDGNIECLQKSKSAPAIIPDTKELERLTGVEILQQKEILKLQHQLSDANKKIKQLESDEVDNNVTFIDNTSNNNNEKVSNLQQQLLDLTTQLNKSNDENKGLMIKMYKLMEDKEYKPKVQEEQPPSAKRIKKVKQEEEEDTATTQKPLDPPTQIKV